MDIEALQLPIRKTALVAIALFLFPLVNVTAQTAQSPQSPQHAEAQPYQSAPVGAQLHPQPEAPSVPFSLKLDTILQDYDGVYCWTQARAAAVPRAGQAPFILVTMQKILLTGSDIYQNVNQLTSNDLGATWQGPIAFNDMMGRRPEGDGVEALICDFWPKWHAATGKVLGIGQTFRYRDHSHQIYEAPRQVAYSVYDPATYKWASWSTLDSTPDKPLPYQTAGGCAQRVDLPNGDILLPVYFREKGEKGTRIKVLRLAFDGTRLSVVAEGPAITTGSDTKRGLAEPSLVHFGGKYYMTIRHDERAYVTTSDDGLTFAEPQVWKWANGEVLPSYNTQAHWVSHSNALFLVYTRRGAGNDHVFRNRAPLFIAEVDTATLRVKERTEQVLIPEKGARYGNFGVCEINENETWIVETEWMQRPPAEPIIPVQNKWGAAGRVYAARIFWGKPNTPTSPAPAQAR